MRKNLTTGKEVRSQESEARTERNSAQCRPIPSLFFMRDQNQRIAGRGMRNYTENFTDFYAMFHDFPRFSAQNRAVFTRFYAFLRVRLIFQPQMDTDEHG